MTPAHLNGRPRSRASDADLLESEVVADAYSALSRLRIADWNEDRGWRQTGGLPAADNPLTYNGLVAARTDSRLLLHPECGNTFALGAVSDRQNYAVGDGGFKIEVVPAPGVTGAEALVGETQRFVDLFAELNDLPGFENEAVERLDRDGEFLTRLFPADGVAELRFVEPERLVPYDPDDTPGGRLSDTEELGIRTDPEDARTVVGYNIDPGDGEAEEVSAAEIVHGKINTPSSFARGWPTFSPAADILRQCDTLRHALAVTAQVRAKLAAIRKTNITRQSADNITAQLTGGQTVYSSHLREDYLFENWPFGAQYRIPQTDSIEFPNAALGAADIETAIQIGLRAAARRTNQPEWMFTGLASEKYANAFVAEAPTIKAFRQLQRKLTAWFGEGRLRNRASVVWRAVRIAVRHELLPREVLTACRIKCTAPSLEARDKGAEAGMHQTYVGMGVYTRQYVRDKIDVPADEADKVDAEVKKFGQAGKVTFLPDGTPAPAADPASPIGGTPGSDAAPVADAAGFRSALADWLAAAARGGLIGCVIDPDSVTPDEFAEWVADYRTGLVLKEVEYHRGGKTYKRRQWVRAGGPKAPPTQAGKSGDTATGHANEADSQTALSKAVADPASLTHEQVWKLRDHMGLLTKDRLKDVARDLELKVGGQKADLADRLLLHVQQQRAGKAKPGDALEDSTPRIVKTAKGSEVSAADREKNLAKMYDGWSAPQTKAHVGKGGARTPEFEAAHPWAGKIRDPEANEPPNRDLPDTTRPPVADRATAEFLNNYSWGYDGQMNAALRETGGPPPGPFGGKESGKPDVDGPAMYDALQKQFEAAGPIGPPPAEVVRGITLPRAAAEKMFEAASVAMESGRPAEMPGFVSTSTGGGFHGNVRFQIRAVHGIDLAPYSHFGYESELLLNHNSKYLVTGVEKVGTGADLSYVFKMDQLPPNSAQRAVRSLDGK